MKHFLLNIFFLAFKQIIRDSVFTISQLILSLIFIISFYLKMYFFVLPDFLPDIKLKISTDVLSITVTILMFFSVIIFILVSLIYNKNRYKTFGIMRGVGARKQFIFFLLFIENIIILFFATVIGILFSRIFFNPSAYYLQRMYSLTIVSDINNFLITIFLSFATIIILSLITALITSLKILISDPYEILRSRE